MTTLTVANAVVTMTVAGVFSSPQTLQQFSADDVFSTDVIEPVEVAMGVDGHLAAGFVYVPIKWSVSLQANSPSNDIFDQWYAAQVAAKEVFPCTVSIRLIGLKATWDLTEGYLSSYPPMADAGKVAKMRKFGLTARTVTKSNA
jgi:hypothetical protein